MNPNLFHIHTTRLTVKEVIDFLEDHLRKNNVIIFARINHAKEAEKVGLTLPDEELLIFGNARVGTELMVEDPLIGIALPLKILAWQEKQETKIAFYNMELLAKEFNIQRSLPVINELGSLLEKLVANLPVAS
jgi:uncharacterized protein (DUF302 family)